MHFSKKSIRESSIRIVNSYLPLTDSPVHDEELLTQVDAVLISRQYIRGSMLPIAASGAADAIASLLVGGPSASSDVRQFDRLKLLERRLTAPIGELSNHQPVAPQNLVMGFESVAVAAAPSVDRAATSNAPQRLGEGDDQVAVPAALKCSNVGSSVQNIEKASAKVGPVSSAAKQSRASSDAGTKPALESDKKRRKYVSGGTKSPDESSKGEAAPRTSPGGGEKPCAQGPPPDALEVVMRRRMATASPCRHACDTVYVSEACMPVYRELCFF